MTSQVCIHCTEKVDEDTIVCASCAEQAAWYEAKEQAELEEMASVSGLDESGFFNGKPIRFNVAEYNKGSWGEERG